MAVSSFLNIGDCVQLLSRTAGGPNDIGGGSSGDWPDSSGNGNNASVADTGARPTIIADPLGDGTGPAPLLANGSVPGYNSGYDTTTPNNVTVFIAANNTGYGGSSGFPYWIGDSSADGDDWGLFEDSGSIYGWNGSSLLFFDDSAIGIHYFVVTKSTNTITYYQITANNGGTQWDVSFTSTASRTHTASLWPNPVYWGSFGDDFSMNGHILCAGIYNKTLSDSGGATSEIGQLFDAMAEEVAGIGDPDDTFFTLAGLGTNM